MGLPTWKCREIRSLFWGPQKDPSVRCRPAPAHTLRCPHDSSAHLEIWTPMPYALRPRLCLSETKARFVAVIIKFATATLVFIPTHHFSMLYICTAPSLRLFNVAITAVMFEFHLGQLRDRQFSSSAGTWKMPGTEQAQSGRAPTM